MRLLLTNDDGIASPFLQALIRAVEQAGHEAVVVAPAFEQSWAGKIISRAREVRVEHRRDLGPEAWAVDGSPADAVNLALGRLLEKPVDAVLSGINIGFNATLPLILNSGTVGAALEAALFGLPAFAFSLVIPREWFALAKEPHPELPDELHEKLAIAAERAVDFAFRQIPDGQPGRQVHNMNFPRKLTRESPIWRTVPEDFRLGCVFSAETAESFRFSFPRDVWATPPEGSDRAALEAEAISHSILDFGALAVP